MGTPQLKPRNAANDIRRLPMPPKALPQVMLPVAPSPVRHVRLAPVPLPRQEFSWAAVLAVFLLGVLIFMLGAVAGTVFWFTYDSPDATRPPSSSPVLARLSSSPVTTMPVIIEAPKPIAPLADTVMPAENAALENQAVPTGKRIIIPLEPPADVDTLLANARMSLEDGENAIALALYERALAQQPDNRDALAGKIFALGSLAAMPDAPPAMMKELQRLSGHAPGDAPVQSALARAFAQHGDMPEAIAHFDQAVRSSPGDVTALFDLATAYDRAGRGSDALMLYRQILQLSGDGDAAILPPETLAAIRRRAAYLAALTTP